MESEFVDGAIRLLHDPEVSDITKLAILLPYAQIPSNRWFLLLDPRPRESLLRFATDHRWDAAVLGGVSTAILTHDPVRRPAAVEAAEHLIGVLAAGRRVFTEVETEVYLPALAVVYFYGDMASFQRTTGALEGNSSLESAWVGKLWRENRQFTGAERESLASFLPPFLFGRTLAAGNALSERRMSLDILALLFSGPELSALVRVHRTWLEIKMPSRLIDEMIAYLDSHDLIPLPEFSRLFGHGRHR